MPVKGGESIHIRGVAGFCYGVCKCNFWFGTLRWVVMWYGGKIFKGVVSIRGAHTRIEEFPSDY